MLPRDEEKKSVKQSVASFAGLPEDISFDVMLCLPISDVLKLRFMSKDLNALVNNEMFWKLRFMSDFYLDEDRAEIWRLWRRGTDPKATLSWKRAYHLRIEAPLNQYQVNALKRLSFYGLSIDDLRGQEWLNNEWHLEALDRLLLRNLPKTSMRDCLKTLSKCNVSQAKGIFHGLDLKEVKGLTSENEVTERIYTICEKPAESKTPMDLIENQQLFGMNRYRDRFLSYLVAMKRAHKKNYEKSNIMHFKESFPSVNEIECISAGMAPIPATWQSPLTTFAYSLLNRYGISLREVLSLFDSNTSIEAFYYLHIVCQTPFGETIKMLDAFVKEHGSAKIHAYFKLWQYGVTPELLNEYSHWENNYTETMEDIIYSSLIPVKSLCDMIKQKFGRTRSVNNENMATQTPVIVESSVSIASSRSSIFAIGALVVGVAIAKPDLVKKSVDFVKPLLGFK